jgi:hypothetical protein
MSVLDIFLWAHVLAFLAKVLLAWCALSFSVCGLLLVIRFVCTELRQIGRESEQ